MKVASMLRLENLQVAYGGIHAVRGANLEVCEGELVALIGANGAGKTSTMKAICNLVAPVGGSVEFMGRSIRGVPAHELLRRGLAMVPEGRGVFARMSVRENLRMGAFLRKDHREIEADISRMFERFPRLQERQHQLAGTLSGGEQQMVAMARAVISRPKLLLLDEPSMGLSPVMVQKVFEMIRELSHQGLTILLVEQNARLALLSAHRGYVMDSGTVTISASAAELLEDPRVRSAYLGE